MSPVSVSIAARHVAFCNPCVVVRWLLERGSTASCRRQGACDDLKSLEGTARSDGRYQVQPVGLSLGSGVSAFAFTIPTARRGGTIPAGKKGEPAMARDPTLPSRSGRRRQVSQVELAMEEIPFNLRRFQEMEAQEIVFG